MDEKILELLGVEADTLLNHQCKTIPKENLHLPGPDFVERIATVSDRPIPVLRNLQMIFNTGRLAGTGYLSILPVDQSVEHSAGSALAPNPIYFDPENIVKLAIEAGCNAVASPLGILGAIARKYAHRVPFILKLNHNELLTCPNRYDQVLQFGKTSEKVYSELTSDHPIDLTRYQVVNCYQSSILRLRNLACRLFHAGRLHGYSSAFILASISANVPGGRPCSAGHKRKLS